MNRLSVWQAIAVGTLWVNIPVIPIMMLPSLVFVLFKTNGFTINERASGGEFLVLLVLFLVGFRFAWLWWAYNVPKWRLWSYQRVDNIELLKSRAVSVGLTWPDGHVFAKTEIKSRAHHNQEAAYEKSKSDGA